MSNFYLVFLYIKCFFLCRLKIYQKINNTTSKMLMWWFKNRCCELMSFVWQLLNNGILVNTFMGTHVYKGLNILILNNFSRYAWNNNDIQLLIFYYKNMDTYTLSCHYLISLIKSYLSNRYIRVKVGDSFCTLHSISAGIPQGSKLFSCLFNIYCHLIL